MYLRRGLANTEISCRLKDMKTETRYIMAIIKFTLVALTAFVVYMSYNEAAANVEPISLPPVAGSPALVMQDCEAPQDGLFPTGVVVQKVGGGTSMVRNQSKVDLRLEQALNKTLPKSLRVLSFCK